MEAGAHGVGRPGAAISPARHFLHVTVALAATEFKLRYFGSVLGYLWTLLRPMMLFGVLYVVFTEIVRFGTRSEHYPVMLLTGIVLYNFFSEATSSGLGSLVARENLLRKVRFPRASIPVAVSLTAAANLGLGLVVVLLLAGIDGVALRASWLGLVPIVVAIVALAIGVAVLLSILYVRFRDVSPIWEVVLQLTFWGSPIIYAVEDVPDDLRQIIMMSPIAVLIQQARHWFVDPGAPTAADAIGDDALLLIPLTIFLGSIALAYVVFKRGEARIPEEL